MQLLGDPEFEMDDLIRVIEMDQAATANLLRMANSAYFGRGASVGTVQDAIVRLGAQRVGQLLMVASVGPVAAKPLAGYDLEPGVLWRHSLAVAPLQPGCSMISVRLFWIYSWSQIVSRSRGFVIRTIFLLRWPSVRCSVRIIRRLVPSY